VKKEIIYTWAPCALVLAHHGHANDARHAIAGKPDKENALREFMGELITELTGSPRAFSRANRFIPYDYIVQRLERRKHDD